MVGRFSVRVSAGGNLAGRTQKLEAFIRRWAGRKSSRDGNVMNHILSQHLDPVARRIRRRQIAVSLAAAWTVAAVICIGLLVSHRLGNLTATTLIPTCAAVLLVSSLVGIFFAGKHLKVHQ